MASDHLPSSWLVEVSILALIVVAAAIPFLNQPFHMDDNFYMDMARNVSQKPFYPYQKAYNFEGRLFPDMGAHSHPPFQAYFLACIMCLTGEGPGKEWIYHAIAMIFPVIAAVAFYFLAARFLRKPLWPALLLICSPVFLVMQHNLMTDIPNLAFWLAAIALFVRAAETNSKAAYFASSVFQFAAMSTSYVSFGLTLLLGFYHLRKRKGLAAWIALLSPPALTAAWIALNCIHYDRFLLAETVQYVQSRHSWSLERLAIKFAAIVQYQGWLIVFPLFLLSVFGRGLIRRFLITAGVIAAYGTWYFLPHYTPLNKGVMVIGLVSGMAVLVQMAGQAFGVIGTAAADPRWAAVERQFVWLWYFGIFASCLLMFPDGSARYILPLVPPTLIMYCRRCEIESRATNESPRNVVLFYGAVLLSGASGMALSQADLEFASIYPRAAADAKRIVGRMESYYAGEWGFRYYSAQAGIKQLPSEPAALPHNGWLVRPKLALPYGLDKASLDMTIPVREIFYHVKMPLRLLDRWSPAGFYSTHWGDVPFSFSWYDQEVIDIRQINYLARNLQAAKIVSQSGVMPKVGSLRIGGKNLTAILVQPGTRIAYPDTGPSMLGLKVQCAVDPDAWADGDECVFEFVIARYSQTGDLLDSATANLRPGVHVSDRTWRTLQLNPVGEAAGASFLELFYSCWCEGRTGFGGFAEPLLFDRTAPSFERDVFK